MQAAENINGFENLAPEIFFKIRQHLRLFDCLELRKATKTWLHMPKAWVHLEHPFPVVMRENVVNNKSLLDFSRVSLSGRWWKSMKHIFPFVGQNIVYLKISGWTERKDWRIDKQNVIRFINSMSNLRFIDVGGIPHRRAELFRLPQVREICEMSIAFKANVYQKTYYFTHFEFTGDFHQQHVLMILTERCREVRSLNFDLNLMSNFNLSSRDEWATLISKLVNIRQLSLRNCDPNFLQMFADHLPETTNLRVLTTDGHSATELTLQTMFEKWGSKLRHFTARETTITGIENCTNLRSLKFENEIIFPIGELRDSLAVETKRNLQVLHLECGEPEGEEHLLGLLSELPNLATLKLNILTDFNHVLETVFEHQTKLRHLDLNMHYTMSEENIFSKLCRLPRLEVLYLDSIFYSVGTLEDITDAIFRLPELRRLKFNNSRIPSILTREAVNITAELRSCI